MHYDMDDHHNEDMHADILREERAKQAAARYVCPECHVMGGHALGCPAEEDDDPEA